MEVTTIRAQIVESQETTMARFLHGFNRDIQEIVELHNHTFISTLVHQVSKVEYQLMTHGRKPYPTTSSNWKGEKKNYLERTKVQRRGCLGNGHVAFQCSNKRTMIHRYDGDIDNESSQEEISTSGSKWYSSEEVSYEGDLLMMVNGNCCSLIIDGGRSINVASLRLVNVKFTLGKYKDEILCDIVPMEATQSCWEDCGNLTKNTKSIKKVVLSKKEPLLLWPKSLLDNLPTSFERILEEFKDICQKEMPKGLPHIRGIEHQIDFMLGSSFLNRLAYRANLEESKDIQI
ncbi:hypothetical protein CR513_28425, partial [Mucuna pruriens]